MSEKTNSRWTPERLRAFKGFENYSNEDAEKAIDTIERLARILLDIHFKKIREERKTQSNERGNPFDNT